MTRPAVLAQLPAAWLTPGTTAFINPFEVVDVTTPPVEDEPISVVSMPACAPFMLKCTAIEFADWAISVSATVHRADGPVFAVVTEGDQ